MCLNIFKSERDRGQLKVVKNDEILIVFPNHKSWDAKYYQECWAAFDVPDTYIISTQKKAELLSQNDLEITKIKGMWFDAFMCLC